MSADVTTVPPVPPAAPATAALVRRVRDSVIGEGAALPTPFGAVPLVYADWTASGRSLAVVEDAIRAQVLPWYANTHSEASGTGRISTALREQARAAVRRSVLGSAPDDPDVAVVFCGSGATAAVDKLVAVLGLKGHAGPAPEARARPVVFVGPYEHHSNELPWRESTAEVVVLGEDATGGIDAAELERHLLRCAGRPLLGSFSAASNVTGRVSDVDGISALLHAHGALACWDYAAGGPHLDVAVGAPGGAHRDAVYLSPHKMVGGPGTPGVLVVRRSALARWAPRACAPAVAGGGTVSYVSPTRHVYLDDVEHREEGGTPDVVGAVRAGLVFALKDAVGVPAIRALEGAALRRVLAALAALPQLHLLGGDDADAERLPIVSFLVRGPGGRYLHHGFVVALLNDLFGVQARGGCSCAGPYGHRLLAIDEATSEAHAALIADGWSGAKPGWVRVSVNWFTADDAVEHLVAAVTAVARHGWALLPAYRFDERTGVWAHRDAASLPPTRLPVVGLDDAAEPRVAPSPVAPSLVECRRRAHAILAAAVEEHRARPTAAPAVPAPRLPAAMEALRWFALPHDGDGSDGGGDGAASAPVTDRTAERGSRRPPAREALARPHDTTPS